MNIDFDIFFNEMRPYTDDEVNSAIKRILLNKSFESVLRYVYSDLGIDEARQRLEKVTTIRGFQEVFSKVAVDSVVKQTVTEFSYSGIENIEADNSYLFISNHRDIVLDSAILQNVLLKNNHRTTQITFGSNLMSSEFIVDLGKVNKMFTFYRGGSRNDIYRNALLHSKYIQHVLNNERESLWIAQRDGRTKDGNDMTQISLLKMLTIKSKNPIETLKQFNIVPVAISYEFEPCDVLKVVENIKSEAGEYIKAPDEDFNSIMSGIVGFKGRVHLAIGKPVNHFLMQNDSITNGNVHCCVANFMDSEIYKNYALNPINYVAYDLVREKNESDCNNYTQQQRIEIEKYFNEVSKNSFKPDAVRKRLIEMYATPVLNKIQVNIDYSICC